MISELTQAKAALADAEAALAEGRGGPYGAQNVETHRRRVERLKAQAPAPAAPIPIPAAHKPAASREDKLRQIGAGAGADATTIAAALASGVTADAFAVQCAESMIAERRAAPKPALALVDDPQSIAARILASDRPAPSKVDADTEAVAVAQRVLAA